MRLPAPTTFQGKQISKKGSLYAVGTAGIMFSALMHFFWLPYPKGIIISLGNTGFVSDALTSAIYSSSSQCISCRCIGYFRGQ